MQLYLNRKSLQLSLHRRRRQIRCKNRVSDATKMFVSRDTSKKSKYCQSRRPFSGRREEDVLNFWTCQLCFFFTRSVVSSRRGQMRRIKMLLVNIPEWRRYTREPPNYRKLTVIFLRWRLKNGSALKALRCRAAGRIRDCRGPGPPTHPSPRFRRPFWNRGSWHDRFHSPRECFDFSVVAAWEAGIFQITQITLLTPIAHGPNDAIKN